MLLEIVQSKSKFHLGKKKSVRCFCFFFSSVSNALPSNQLSNIPWRRSGVKYTNNEAYFDLIEEIDAIIDRNGVTIMCEVQGYVSREKKK